MAEKQAPVTISMIGTGTGDGGGVTPTPNGTLLKTPEGQPNLIANVVTPVVAILVRAVNVFLTTFLAVLTAAGVGVKILAATDLQGTVAAAAWAGLIAAGLATVKNIITIGGRMEGKYPLVTGSI